MRTTVRLDDELYATAKAVAARSGRSVAAVIEDALRRSFVAHAEPDERDTAASLPVFGGSGVLAGIDLADNRSLRDAMEFDTRLDARR